MDTTKIKILIVDDNATIRKNIRDILSQAGFSLFVEAEDGKFAIKQLYEHNASAIPINFVISDWNMPSMTGIEFLKFCRTSEKFKSIPFILCTGERLEAQIVEAVKAKVTDYIVKPFSADKILSKIAKVYGPPVSKAG